MGKRIYRISSEEAQQQKANLIGHELNLVLQNSTVFFGRLKSLDNSRFWMENMLGKPFHFALQEVKEVIYDKRSIN